MRRTPKTLRVFPNPWGVHPNTLDPVQRRDPKTRALKDHYPLPHTCTLDSRGRPSGMVLAEVTSRAVPTVVRYVGCRVDEARTRKLQKLRRGDNLRSERQETVFAFLGESAHELKPFALADAFSDKAPVEIEFSAYYLDRIRDGSLIAGDEQAARLAGVRYRDPSKLFRPLAELAVKVFNAQFEDEKDVYQTLCRERANAAAVEAPAEATGDQAPSADSDKKDGRRASRNKKADDA